ncbi:MAG: hypothetical protein U1C46_08730 [Bacteroidales bacterium]|nr:hypothetical protein [Bacteroidales bacterium]MDZ4204887.1 hypothetical protein [Bacteroidales bacterium]
MNPVKKHPVHQFARLRPSFGKLLSSRVLLFSLVGIMAIGGTSCSSQKRLAKRHAKEARLAQIEQAKADLHEIINDDGSLSFEVKERKFLDIKDMNLDDKEVKKLLPRAEEKLAKDRVVYLRQKEEELKRKEEELRERERLEKEQRMTYNLIQDALYAVATAPDLRSANTRISEALSIFASPDVPVLILISRDGAIKDYDRPTTIRKYLEMLKDQKKYNNDIENVLFDAAGKITELELKKRF